jgi:hypothetical protein
MAAWKSRNNDAYRSPGARLGAAAVAGDCGDRSSGD